MSIKCNMNRALVSDILEESESDLTNKATISGINGNNMDGNAIDIELIKDKIERIANKFLSAKELEFIQEQERIEQLYVCWCAKEAIYKLHGKKNVSFVENIDLKPFHYSGNGSFSANLDVGSIHKEFKVHYEKFDEYMIGFVSDDNNEE